MILADSSAWVEYLRRTESPVHHRLRQLIDDAADLAITEVVVLEVLAGARDGGHRDALRDLIYRHPVLMTELADYERAADLYRSCRRRRETVRKMTDCLIAAVAIREDAAVLHRDAGFDVIARHTRLRVEV